MLKKLFAVGEVVAPDADTFPQSRFVRLYDRLIVEFV